MIQALSRYRVVILAGVLMLAGGTGCAAAPPASDIPTTDACAARTEFTLQVTADQLSSTIEVLTTRVEELAYPTRVSAVDGNTILVVACQALNDTEVASVTRLVSTSGVLSLRRVYGVQPSPPPGQEASPSASWPSDSGPSGEASIDELVNWEPSPQLVDAFSAWACGGEPPVGQAVPDVTGQPTFACDNTSQKYLLGPVLVDGTFVIFGSVATSQGQVSDGVTVVLNPAGVTRLSQATAVLVGKPSPRNQLAIVLDGQVLTAPAVMDPITSGKFVIAGDFPPYEAATLAGILHTAAKPIHVTVASVVHVP